MICNFGVPAAYTPVDTTHKTTKYYDAVVVRKPADYAVSPDDSTDSESTCICVDCALPISDSKYGGDICACCDDGESDGKTSEERRSGFPGITARAQCNHRNMTKQRLGNPSSLLPTSGNALMEYVRGIVQADHRAGNTPDSSGRSAQVMMSPFGCTDGSTFLAKMPSDQDQGGVHDLQLPEEKADLVVVQRQDYYGYTTPAATPPPTSPTSPTAATTTTTITTVTTKVTTTTTTRAWQPQSHKNQGKDMKMLVNAPKGVSAGTTIHVLVPYEGNEKRYLPVTIPEGGVSQFHVQCVRERRWFWQGSKDWKLELAQ